MDRMTLGYAEWRTRPGLDRVEAALDAAHGAARYVGGAVRDTLLGLPVTDLDLATIHPPGEVVARLEAAGIKAVPTGIAHGTVTAVASGTVVEVTTLRRDVATDGRHAEVAFTDDWQADAARRDFTINALYADPATGAIFDYFDGLDDLAAGRVRFIGDPLARIAEDHLRILRFFRFLARFGDTPDPPALAACVARANDLMALSRERIADELRKLVVTRGAVEVLTLMVEHGVLRPVIPEIDGAGLARLARVVAREAALALAPDPLRRLAALLSADATVAEGIAARLKLSNAARRRIALAQGPLDRAPRALAFAIGREAAVDRLLLSPADDAVVVGALGELDGWEVPTLPVGGGDLIARGVVAGPDVARLLGQVRESWVAENFPEADRARAIADDIVAQWLRSTR